MTVIAIQPPTRARVTIGAPAEQLPGDSGLLILTVQKSPNIGTGMIHADRFCQRR